MAIQDCVSKFESNERRQRRREEKFRKLLEAKREWAKRSVRDDVGRYEARVAEERKRLGLG